MARRNNGSVNVATGLGNFVAIPCMIIGPFAVHRTIYRATGFGWSLTLRHNGRLIRRFHSRKLAEEVAKELEKFGDWSTPVGLADQGVREEATRLMNRMAPLSG